MKMSDILNEDGRIVKGVNTTADVGPDEIKKQAKKFGNTVDKDGNPPTLSKKVKGKSTNVLYNLGLTEGYKLQLERDKELLVLHIKDTATGKRTEVRGKPGYETNYDPNDKLHQLLDKVGKSANISELINGEVVTINPNHPDADRAKAATDKAYNENFADGKVKGKSRPGRVKRSGASCNGSVTDLRKRAKNASGEKAKMYHWCANMKSGKKK
jgi:phosphotransferase system HPr-like phosphotransfer protein